MRTITKIALVFAVLLPWQKVLAQDSAAVANPFRWMLDTKFGSEPAVGFNAPNTSFGPSIEYPLDSEVELQGAVSFSPWRSVNDWQAHSIEISGAGIGWISTRWGVSLGFRHDWLWLPQSERSGWNPSLGAVFRHELYRPGRLYLTYLFPTGCNQLSTSCLTPSGRTQGFQALEEIRLWSRVRVGLQGGLYHYCSSPSPDSRDCKFSPAGMVIMRFEFRSEGTGSY